MFSFPWVTVCFRRSCIKGQMTSYYTCILAAHICTHSCMHARTLTLLRRLPGSTCRAWPSLGFRSQVTLKPSYFLSRDAGGILSLYQKGSGVIYSRVKSEMDRARLLGAEGSHRDRQPPCQCVSETVLGFLRGPFSLPPSTDGSGPST